MNACACLIFDYAATGKTVDRITRLLRPKMPIVFGSVTRKEAGDDSGLDILVVMNADIRHHAKRAAEIRRDPPDIPLSMDIIVRTQISKTP